MKKIYLLSFLFMALSLNVSSQDKWEAGLFLGGSSYFGDLVHSDYTPYLSQTGIAFGADVRYSFNQNFSAQLNFLHAGLKGDDEVRAENGSGVTGRNINFTGGTNQIGGILRWEPWGHKRYDDQNSFNRIISPYIFAGVAYEFINVDPDYSKATGSYVALSLNDKVEIDANNSNFNIPMGAGVRFDFNEKVGLDFELGINRASSDFIDGVSMSGNPDNNDWYFAGGVRLSVKLSDKKDSDKDGIADEDDPCPNIAGVASANGCPDMDGDGIEDSKDDCPSVAGTKDLGGCPDTDGDGIRDIDDDCPEEKGGINGCPDSDGDGISDKVELAMGTDPNNEDSDGDNITDGIENPNGNATVDKGESDPRDACDPLINADLCDQDKDGLVNSADECPTEAGSIAAKGCPDSDNDGILNKYDKCPNAAGPKSNEGCPELNKEEKEVFDLAISNIQFESNSNILKLSSVPTLSKIVDIMKKYPYYNLKISGHTDSRGHRADNLKLSENRAKACLSWLAGKGIDRARMESAGYGESQPIADNINEAGRKQNRRVVFELIIK
jgi:outer membrane protein OmpA-like peptidoglycan-associated protein